MSTRFQRALHQSSGGVQSGMETKPKYKLFLDLDGVLADFDSKVEEITGVRPDRSQPKAEASMWKAIERYGTFYRDLDPMPDAMELWDYCSPFKPTILTGISMTPGCAKQKREWVAAYLDTDVPVITCESKNKAAEALKVTPEGVIPVLVDDWTKYSHVWEQAGGIFILHTSAKSSIQALKNLGM